MTRCEAGGGGPVSRFDRAGYAPQRRAQRRAAVPRPPPAKPTAGFALMARAIWELIVRLFTRR